MRLTMLIKINLFISRLFNLSKQRMLGIILHLPGIKRMYLIIDRLFECVLSISDRPIRGLGGPLDVSIREYDRKRRRPLLVMHPNRAFFYAPFVSMDFSQTGHVRPCNHFVGSIPKISEDKSLLDIWQGELHASLRRSMHEYNLNDGCEHCIRQIKAGSLDYNFAGLGFDDFAVKEAVPAYPRRLSFELNNTCNLACVMCHGTASSVIRRERDKLPPLESVYDEKFFNELEKILEHVEHIAFYGGEPLLIKENYRIFDILKRVNPKCRLFINTNATVINERAKHYLQELNFTAIAVSMDASDPELLSEVRQGLNYEAFRDGLDWIIEMTGKRGIYLSLNVTEHRKNWFNLPEVFRFAERAKLPIHITHCLYPTTVSLYTLPDEELRYVLSFLLCEKQAILEEFPGFMNLKIYDYMISLITDELNGRDDSWQPVLSQPNHEITGNLAAPRPGVAPFHVPERLRQEVDKILKLSKNTSSYMLREIEDRIEGMPNNGEWQTLLRYLKNLDLP